MLRRSNALVERRLRSKMYDIEAFDRRALTFAVRWHLFVSVSNGRGRVPFSKTSTCAHLFNGACYENPSVWRFWSWKIEFHCSLRRTSLQCVPSLSFAAFLLDPPEKWMDWKSISSKWWPIGNSIFWLNFYFWRTFRKTKSVDYKGLEVKLTLKDMGKYLSSGIIMI